MKLEDMMAMSEFELKALMLLSLDGDENAYRCLLGILRHLLESYFKRRLASNGQDTDDLIRIRFWRCISAGSPTIARATFTAWFFTIARHKLVDHHTATRRAIGCQPGTGRGASRTAIPKTRSSRAWMWSDCSLAFRRGKAN